MRSIVCSCFIKSSIHYLINHILSRKKKKVEKSELLEGCGVSTLIAHTHLTSSTRKCFAALIHTYILIYL